MKIRIYLFALLMGIFSSVESKSLDSQYVKTYYNQLQIKPYLTHNFMSINYDLPRKLPVEVLKPNNSYDLGACLGYKWLAICYGVAIFNAGDEKIYGKTSDMDLQINVYAKKHIIDFTYQNYIGFYVSNVNDITKPQPGGGPGASNPTKPYPIRRDMEIFNYALNYIYAFNGNKLSFAAAFAQSQRQMKSVGSPLVGASFSYFKIHTDSSILPDNHIKKDSFTSDDHFVEGGFICPAIKAGYAYNLIFLKHFSLFASVVPGLSFEINEFKNREDKYATSFKLNFQAQGRFSLIYNTDKAFFGVSANTNFYTHKLRDASFTFLTTRAEVFVGYRFTAPKFMRSKKERDLSQY